MRFWHRRRTAVSIAHGKLVAARTRRPSRLFPSPSICTSSSVFIRREDSLSLSERTVAMESISSMKMMAGFSSLAVWNRVLTSFSLSPSHFDVRSALETERKVASDSEATALARKLLPVPGGPYSIIPDHGVRPPPAKSCGNLIGRITASLSASLADSRPATSSHLMLGFSVMIVAFRLSLIFVLSFPSLSSPSAAAFFLTGSFRIDLIFSALSMYSIILFFSIANRFGTFSYLMAV
mmetsp:Transcript_22933/g.54284  ORF Transcript_22933/g.54284 Transcript_22933/m.54284 type:complete len:237 (+) Transcript_22933:624-1334(+)